MAEDQRSSDRTFEIVEVIVLAMVAIATAFSGYQGTKWGGQQALLYGQASTTRFQADAASTLGGQTLIADASFFTAWLQAHAAGDTQLEALFEKRFTPEYKAAFDEWLDTDPFHDPNAPPGPGAMPGFTNPDMAEAAQLNAQASADFAEGTTARETANTYIRNTVLFASVLFFVAIAQRFKIRRVRMSANAIAVVLLTLALASMLSLPRI